MGDEALRHDAAIDGIVEVGIGRPRSPARRGTALSAHQHAPAIRAFSKRLTAAGKPYYKVRMTSCMLKVLVTLNAMVHAGTPWSPAP